MTMPAKRVRLLALLLALSLALCGCAREPSEEELYGKLFAYLADRGYDCAFADGAPIENPAIYDETAWRAVDAGGETLYVYFDESNRADYLLSGIDQSVYGYAARYGLRFVVNYRGADEGLLDALEGMPR